MKSSKIQQLHVTDVDFSLTFFSQETLLFWLKLKNKTKQNIPRQTTFM